MQSEYTSAKISLTILMFSNSIFLSNTNSKLDITAYPYHTCFNQLLVYIASKNSITKEQHELICKNGLHSKISNGYRTLFVQATGQLLPLY